MVTGLSISIYKEFLQADVTCTNQKFSQYCRCKHVHVCRLSMRLFSNYVLASGSHSTEADAAPVQRHSRRAAGASGRGRQSTRLLFLLLKPNVGEVSHRGYCILCAGKAGKWNVFIAVFVLRSKMTRGVVGLDCDVDTEQGGAQLLHVFIKRVAHFSFERP